MTPLNAFPRAGLMPHPGDWMLGKSHEACVRMKNMRLSIYLRAHLRCMNPPSGTMIVDLNWIENA